MKPLLELIIFSLEKCNYIALGASGKERVIYYFSFRVRYKQIHKELMLFSRLKINVFQADLFSSESLQEYILGSIIFSSLN